MLINELYFTAKNSAANSEYKVFSLTKCYIKYKLGNFKIIYIFHW